MCLLIFIKEIKEKECRMSIEKVKAYFETKGIADRIREMELSSATVELAAKALGCEPAYCQNAVVFCKGRTGSCCCGRRCKN